MNATTMTIAAALCLLAPANATGLAEEKQEVPRPDKHHYGPEGYLQVGRLFARKVVETEKAGQAQAESEADAPKKKH